MFITQLKLCETNISYRDMLIIIDSVIVSWILKISEAIESTERKLSISAIPRLV